MVSEICVSDTCFEICVINSVVDSRGVSEDTFHCVAITGTVETSGVCKACSGAPCERYCGVACCVVHGKAMVVPFVISS